MNGVSLVGRNYEFVYNLLVDCYAPPSQKGSAQELQKQLTNLKESGPALSDLKLPVQPCSKYYYKK